MIFFHGGGGMGELPISAPVNKSGNKEKKTDIPRKVLRLDQRVV